MNGWYGWASVFFVGAVASVALVSLNSELQAARVSLTTRDARIAWLTHELASRRAGREPRGRATAVARTADADREPAPPSPVSVQLPPPCAATTDPTEPEDPSLEMTAEQIDEGRRAEIDSLARQLASEDRDRDWAPAAEMQLTEATRRFGRRADFSKINCKATICEVVMLVRNPAERDAEVRELLVSSPFASQAYADVPEDTRQATTVYLAREGHALSALVPSVATLDPPPVGDP